MSAQSSIRIIGGKWRSRKVSFETKDPLRPTPDRVRETLFNWLAPHIAQATCLDLYAGSAVLAFEALSRGAKFVTAVESDRDNVVQIERNKSILNAEQLLVINKDVIAWLQDKAYRADIIFVDPPYKLHLLAQTLDLLDRNAWVNAQGFIYFEQNTPLDAATLPKAWRIWRESKAGNVYFYLARNNA